MCGIIQITFVWEVEQILSGYMWDFISFRDILHSQQSVYNVCFTTAKTYVIRANVLC